MQRYDGGPQLNWKSSHVLFRQFISSDPSVQSCSPSHFHVFGMQVIAPPLQWNSSPVYRKLYESTSFSLKATKTDFPRLQNMFLRKLFYSMMCEDIITLEIPVQLVGCDFKQSLSSVPSTQSFSPSHLNRSDTHWPFSQVSSVLLQLTLWLHAISSVLFTQSASLSHLNSYS